ncbi:MAG: NAD/NADP octopine/nopaline dehydrogenase family protein [Sedimentisphaerales bacterium]|nr:NAD/NADP octopine/nopaline dehydrogenase family protein [Sedimentisphaerales bacterium]
MKAKEICIIGAGNGGSAIAGDMSLAGHHCRLFEFPEYRQNIDPVIKSGCIKVTGIARTGTANVKLATVNLAEAVKGAEVIMVTTQALAHERTARELAPILEDGQVVILWPGSGGTLVLRKIWDEMGMSKRVLLGEGVTFPYCCRRLEGPGTVNIHRVDGPNMLIAALPATHTSALIKALQGTYTDKVKPARSILEPALYNVNIIVHPVGALLNMGRIEYSKGEFYMYKEGITPSVKKVIYAMDRERSNLFTRLGYKPYTYDEVFFDCFNMTVQEFAATSSKGPFSMQDRYVTEDIPMGASLTVSLARKAGIPTPTYDTLIHLASVVNDTDFYAGGRTLQNLGMDKWFLEDFEAYLQTGAKPL